MDKIEMWKKLYMEGDGILPLEAGFDENPKRKSYDFRALYYFGNCITTVSSDHIWDATQMAGVLLQSNVVPFKDAEGKLMGGDRKLPAKLTRWIEKNPEKLDDESEIVCGYNERQRIFFIYITDFDVHFFFDAKLN